MELSNLAFLESYTLKDKEGIMGAILVTDSDTKPVEFRVTAPITPTNFQRTLYGNVLMEHILVELISAPLLNAVSLDLDIIIVRNPLFLGANDRQGVRVVRLFDKNENISRESSAKEELLSNNGDNSNIFAEISRQYESELPEIKESLKYIAESRNLLEPFERLKIACEQVHLQKMGD
jgi:hypothetical protein